MNLDLQKITLRRLIETQDHELYTKLARQYFSGLNLLLFVKIEGFYKKSLRLPSIEEFTSIRKDSTLQQHWENEILHEENISATVQSEFLVAQLQDYCVREETIKFLNEFLDSFEEYESVEIVDAFQNHLLRLNEAIPISDECYDIADMDLIPKGDSFTLYTSGLSSEYDARNGGFALQELVMLGGRRGSGKSIISLNLALHRFLQGNTVSFFTIEMRHKEVHDRLLSIISGVPFLDIFKNQTTLKQDSHIINSKLDLLYKSTDKLNYFKTLFSNAKNKQDLIRAEQLFKNDKPEFKEHRFFIIDDESLTLNRIDHYSNMFSNKYSKYTMGVVDYLNIIKTPDGKDWKAQIQVAEELKRVSRKYDLTMLTPYQTDATGEARFSKGILDSADRSFIFHRGEETENTKGGNYQYDNGPILVNTTKIRNGARMDFDVDMDWECVKVISDKSSLSKEKPHKIAMYGSDQEEKEMDLS